MGEEVLDFKFDGVCNAGFAIWTFSIPRSVILRPTKDTIVSTKSTIFGQIRGLFGQIFQNTPIFAELGALCP